MTRVVVLDNLKEGVLEPDVHDPGLDPVYRDMLAHYSATALPCRVRHPDRKGKTKSGVRHARTKLQGRRFECGWVGGRLVLLSFWDRSSARDRGAASRGAL